MGHHMGMNLIKNGYTLVVYDVYPEAMKNFEDLGSTAASSPKMLAEQVDTIITMLPSRWVLELTTKLLYVILNAHASSAKFDQTD